MYKMHLRIILNLLTLMLFATNVNSQEEPFLLESNELRYLKNGEFDSLVDSLRHSNEFNWSCDAVINSGEETFPLVVLIKLIQIQECNKKWLDIVKECDPKKTKHWYCPVVIEILNNNKSTSNISLEIKSKLPKVKFLEILETINEKILIQKKLISIINLKLKPLLDEKRVVKFKAKYTCPNGCQNDSYISDIKDQIAYFPDQNETSNESEAILKANKELKNIIIEFCKNTENIANYSINSNEESFPDFAIEDIKIAEEKFCRFNNGATK